MDWGPGYREQQPPAGLLPSVACLWARVAGPDTGPAPSVSPPGTVFAALRFVPGAAGPALGLPMSELLNQRVDAADLGTGPGTELARALPGTLAPAQALATLTRMAGALIAEGPADPLAARAARLPRHPGARAAGIAGRLEVSERQLRRRCQAAVGYGPATLRRVLRFRRFVSWIDAGAGGKDGTDDGELAVVAADLGYADQAHLTRESVRLAGLPPTALVAARRP